MPSSDLFDQWLKGRRLKMWRFQAVRYRNRPRPRRSMALLSFVTFSQRTANERTWMSKTYPKLLKLVIKYTSLPELIIWTESTSFLIFPKDGGSWKRGPYLKQNTVHLIQTNTILTPWSRDRLAKLIFVLLSRINRHSPNLNVHISPPCTLSFKHRPVCKMLFI